MKTMRNMQMAAVSISAAMALAMVGQAEKPATMAQPAPVQQEKHGGDLTLSVIVPDHVGESQSAQQKVTLEYLAADAQVVKGKPYSADTSTETVQTLPDGNRIVHQTVSKFARDSEGRTRREQTFGNVDPEHPSPHEVKIFIDDPVNKTAFVLDPGSKTADKMQKNKTFFDDRIIGDDGAVVMSKSVKDNEEIGPDAPGPMLVKFRNDQTNPGTMTLQIQDDKREVSKEDLGTKNIEGVECTGTRQTTTIPAGAIGNERSISMVTETWFAPSIGAVVESTSDDPRYGKTTYQLKNVQLNEPARSLFEPPADFKISARK